MKEVLPYWKDPLIDEFEVSIEECTHSGENFEILIKENVIRPAGGGQAGDRGILHVEGRAIPIIDTAQSDTGIILLTKKAVPKGSKGVISIDTKWRKAMMMNHSAEHLYVGTLQKLDNELNLGYIWIDGERAVIEISGEVDTDILYKAERESQKIVEEDVALYSEYIDSSELDAEIRAREGVALKELVRIIRIGEFDASACSGTHVKSTGEISFLKLTDYKVIENGVQLEILTGPRAIEWVSSIYNQLLQRKHTYPFELQQIGAVLDKGKKCAHEQSSLVERISEIISKLPANEIVNEIQFRYEMFPGFSSNQLRNALKTLSLEGPTAILFFAPGEKSNLIFWTNDLPKDASEYIASKIIELGGRGGGKGDSYTGGFTEVENPEGLFMNLIEYVRNQLKQ